MMAASNGRMQMRQQRLEDKAAYDASPVACDVCEGPIPFARWRKGAKLCGRQCGLDKVRKANRTSLHAGRKWFCYIVRCCDGSLYTGMTTDVARRVKQHNTRRTGAKYTRAKRPVKLVHQEECLSRQMASRREAEIKKLSHAEKESLVHGRNL